MKSFVQAMQPEAENTVWSTVLIGVETAAVGQTGVPAVTEDEMLKTEASIANKLARRAFTGGFVLAALTEIGCQVIHLKRSLKRAEAFEKNKRSPKTRYRQNATERFSNSAVLKIVMIGINLYCSAHEKITKAGEQNPTKNTSRSNLSRSSGTEYVLDGI